MKYDYVAERYPYVDSMTNVKNPYAIVTGGNLLPPFTEWETEPNAMAIAVSPYEAVAEITSDGTKAPLRTIIPVLPNTVYTVSSEGNAIPPMDCKSSNAKTEKSERLPVRLVADILIMSLARWL
ncbi:hypothetical protein FLT15_16955 [Paenibacillus thiaminolyticus]|uniref:hypothetical protein n=1 Tax=Paenibacillus thiaminolyticus TaxID=49283 RepID=UPI0013F66207|nr:hypothetical protein [Paenibacillus thiaminolyticus]NGP59977.1 hypothetical protein [Paenibacillus thiaminolyticus]